MSSFDFVVSGLPIFGDEADRREWARQMDLRRANTCLLADSFHKAGFVVVIDDFVTSIGSRGTTSRRRDVRLG